MPTRLFEPRFTVTQLRQILEQSELEGCACPMELSGLLLKLIDLYIAQDDCVFSHGKDPDLHAGIARMVAHVAPQVEACLVAVLEAEGWNAASLERPTATSPASHPGRH